MRNFNKKKKLNFVDYKRVEKKIMDEKLNHLFNIIPTIINENINKCDIYENITKNYDEILLFDLESFTEFLYETINYYDLNDLQWMYFYLYYLSIENTMTLQKFIFISEMAQQKAEAMFGLL